MNIFPVKHNVDLGIFVVFCDLLNSCCMFVRYLYWKCIGLVLEM